MAYSKIKTGAELVSDLIERRKRSAQALRELRKELKSTWATPIKGKQIKFINSLARDLHRLGGRSPQKPPTADEAFQAARRCLEFARSSWHNPYDSEYYSACGYDDYCYDQRDYARRVTAVECFRIWQYLKSQEVTR